MFSFDEKNENLLGARQKGVQKRNGDIRNNPSPFLEMTRDPFG